MKRKGNLVYSTEHGNQCPACGKPLNKCQCRTKASRPDGDGIVRLQRQSKGRAGKPVVLVTGLPLSDAELKKLAKQLKSKCGVGGSIEDGTIIIQGDKREVLKAELESAGYTVKLSGG